MFNEFVRIQALLDGARFESARRLVLKSLSDCTDPETRLELLLRLHEIHVRQGDFTAADATRAQIHALKPEPFADALRHAVSAHRRLGYDFYRGSAESRRGLSYDEYVDIWRAVEAEQFAIAKTLALTPTQHAALASALQACGRHREAIATTPDAPMEPAPADEVTSGVLEGRICFPDNTPAAGVEVILGLADTVIDADPTTYLRPDMHYAPSVSDPQTLETRTDADGVYRFDPVPAGTHAYLAVRLDPTRHDVATRFIAFDLDVAPHQTNRRDAMIDTWRSAPALPFDDAFAPERSCHGRRYRRVVEKKLRNPFYCDFPRQPLSIVGNVRGDRDVLVLRSDDPHSPLACQRVPDGVLVLVDLPMCRDLSIGVYESVDSCETSPSPGLVVDESPDLLRIDTGVVALRIPSQCAPADAPPLQSMRSERGKWLGTGRLHLDAGFQVAWRTVDVLENGPLRARVGVGYTLTSGDRIRFTITSHAGERAVLVHESGSGAGATFDFSVREFASPGRCFLQWNAENGPVHWSSIAAEDRELARLQENVPWWIPPQGFACALTPDAMDAPYLACFTIRRGEWIDRAFERIAQGPGDSPAWRREMDWPFPEMMGSPISAITAQSDTTGDLFFRFRSFDGERQWGLLLSTLDRNDGPMKELSQVQHKYSSPRLQEFVEWSLDVADASERPHLLLWRDQLPVLHRKRTQPAFSIAWKRLTESTDGVARAMRFHVEQDPRLAWKRKRHLVGMAHIRSRMTLLGREFSDMYSPVGGRPITEWAQEYDLLAPSGVFTPDEERLVRQFLLLMGYLYMEPDLMNWRYNARNANFEADRADVVGTIGLAFAGTPGAQTMIAHARQRLESMLRIYCTPGSGRWYENLACYYLQASKCWMNLAYHFATRGIIDVEQVDRLKDFLRWGVLTLTPPAPADYETMRDGVAFDEYESLERVRRIPPIGDHAEIGRAAPDHYALMARAFRTTDPALADLLRWTYLAGGQGGAGFGNTPLLLAQLDEADLAPRGEPARDALVTRRLEGFGAVLRDHVGTPQEFYLLIKQGPGGYRYHRTEGSFCLFAEGRPLVYDGGEGGETWRHSTLSFDDTHLPLSPGQVERFVDLPDAALVQGVHPVAIEPGMPACLCDDCRPELIRVAEERYWTKRPAASRSWVWVRDQYVLLHDALDLSAHRRSHWHLQVVADDCSLHPEHGYRFRGRFGVDLQVLLPGQAFDSTDVQPLPLLEYRRAPKDRFSMRHLRVSGAPGTPGYLAILRPLRPGAVMVSAESVRDDNRIVGARVRGGGVDDTLWLARDGTQSADFVGRFGGVLRRQDTTVLTLFDGARVRSGNLQLHSEGVRASLRVQGSLATLTTRGAGHLRVEGLAEPVELHLPEGRFEQTYRVR